MIGPFFSENLEANKQCAFLNKVAPKKAPNALVKVWQNFAVLEIFLLDFTFYSLNDCHLTLFRT